ncbi:LapA family protein [Notoacmeibacter ruber]|uniref:LapA family protein n=1 Tax=Notoacmeibacter ruber TaxID=2670375 RepID=A0A3L7J8U0_9HYPH|nr:LapA family protein [Notoacmeibacter ruber]RLQ86909.1 LapA family protein [Notoacmeibacter ruber]
MISRILTAVILVPLAIILVALAVVNRQSVPLTLDIFQTGNENLSIALPLFIWLLAALILGMVIGGVASWIRQGRYRRLAKKRKHEVERLENEIPPRQEKPYGTRDDGTWPYGRDDGTDTGVTGTQLAGLPSPDTHRA